MQAGAARQHDARHSLSDQSGRTASTCPSTSVYGRRWKEAAHAATELGLGVGDAVPLLLPVALAERVPVSDAEPVPELVAVGDGVVAVGDGVAVREGVGGAEPVCDGVGGTEPETDTEGVGGRLGVTDGDGCTTERSKLSPTHAMPSLQRIERRHRSALHVPDSARDVAVPSNAVISLSPAISAMRIQKPLGL